MLKNRHSSRTTRGRHISCSPTRQPPVKGGSYDCELMQIMRERDEMHGMLEKYKRHLSEIQGNIKVLTADRDKTSMLYQQAQAKIAQLRRELLTSKQVSSLRSNVMAQNILKHVEAERDEAAADLRRMTTERDSLRERLKISQETSIRERAHLEQRVEDLQNTILKLEQERGEQTDRQAVMREAMVRLEAEIHSMGCKMATMEEELSRAKKECDISSLAKNQTEDALTEAQCQLTTKMDELQRCQEKNIQLDEKNDSLIRQLSDLKEQVSTLHSTVDELTQSRNALQEQLELKNELLSSTNQELELKSGLLSSANQQLEMKNDTLSSVNRELELKSTMISSANQQLEMKSQLLSSANQQLDDKENSLTRLELSVEELEISIRSLQEMLGRQEHDLEAARRAKEATLQENEQLRDDLDKAHLDSQVLQLKVEDSNQEMRELKRKIQGYVADASRMEHLLSAKERECKELQENRRRAEEKARQADAATEEARVELLGSETEKRRLKERVEDLEAKLHEAQQHLDSCSSEVELLHRQLFSERLSLRSLEATLLSSCRTEMEHQPSSQERNEKIQQLRDQLASADSKACCQSREVAHLRTRSAQLEADLEMTKKQLKIERLEREQAVQELCSKGLSSSPPVACYSYCLQNSRSPERGYHSLTDHLGSKRSPDRNVKFRDLHY